MKYRQIFIVALFAILTATVFVSCRQTERPLSAVELLNLGERYLLELNYEQALVHFTLLIEVEPMNVRAYIGAAEAYIGLGDIDSAVAILQLGLERLPGDAELQALLDTITMPLDYTLAPDSEIDVDDGDIDPMLTSNWREVYIEILSEYAEIFSMVNRDIYWHLEPGVFLLHDIDHNGIPELIIGGGVGHDSHVQAAYAFQDSVAIPIEIQSGESFLSWVGSQFGMMSVYAPANNHQGLILSSGMYGTLDSSHLILDDTRLIVAATGRTEHPWGDVWAHNPDYDGPPRYFIDGIAVDSGEYYSVFGVSWERRGNPVTRHTFDDENIQSAILGW